jgi:hypothetical protein
MPRPATIISAYSLERNLKIEAGNARFLPAVELKKLYIDKMSYTSGKKSFWQAGFFEGLRNLAPHSEHYSLLNW